MRPYRVGQAVEVWLPFTVEPARGTAVAGRSTDIRLVQGSGGARWHAGVIAAVPAAGSYVVDVSEPLGRGWERVRVPAAQVRRRSSRGRRARTRGVAAS